MWRYQRPGFKALLLAELQRQQSGSQFCDTVLRADGVSVPAHSCVLSALSPQISHALSTSPGPPSGQSHLLEFRSFAGSSLLRLVGLLYSGEMVGDGEAERREAITAAAGLGIQGLVEVGRRENGGEVEGVTWQRQREGVPQRDVGVQTDPQQNAGAPETKEGGRWRRENSVRLRETDNPTEETSGVRDCESKGYDADPSDSNGRLSPGPVPFSTVDSDLVSSLTGSGRPVLQSASHVDDVTTIHGTEASGLVVPVPPSVPLFPNVSHIPLSHLFYCPPAETHAPNKLPPPVFMSSGESAPVYLLPPSEPSLSHATSGPVQVNEGPPPPTSETPQTWVTGLLGGGGAGHDGHGEVEGFERFEGNIAGFISYFLDSAQPAEGNPRGRRGRRRVSGGARRGGTERRARRSRGRSGTRGGAKKTGSDVEQEVKEVSQRGMLWRCGVRACRTGRGGGVVGRKLCLKPREVIQPIKICLKRRGRGKVWEIVGVKKERGGASWKSSAAGRGQQKPGPKFIQEVSPGMKRQRGRPERLPILDPTTPLQDVVYVQPSSSKPRAPAPYLAPSQALLHTATLPPMQPPTQEDSSEQLDRLLEDIMKDLDFPCGGHQDAGRGVAAAAPGAVETVTEVTKAGGGSGGAQGSLERGQAAGELSDILDHFLRSFEQQVAALNPGEVNQTATGLSEPHSRYVGAQIQTGTAEHREPPTQVSAKQTYPPSQHAPANTVPHPAHTGANTDTHLHMAPPTNSLPSSPGSEVTVIPQTHPTGRVGILPVVEKNPDLARPLIKRNKERSALRKGRGKKQNQDNVHCLLPGVADAFPGVSVHVGEALHQQDAVPRKKPVLGPPPNQVADMLLGGCVQSMGVTRQPTVCIVRLEKTMAMPGAESLKEKCPPIINRPIRLAEKLNNRTETQSAAGSEFTLPTPGQNPQITPVRTPEKLTGQRAQPIRHSKDCAWQGSETGTALKKQRGRPKKERKFECAEIIRLHHPTEQTGRPAEQTGHPTEQTGHPTEPTGHPAEQTGHLTEPTGPLTEPTGRPAEQTAHLTEPTGRPAEQTGHPAEQTGHLTEQTGHLTEPTGHPAEQTGHLTEPTGHLTEPTGHLTEPTGRKGVVMKGGKRREDNIPQLGLESGSEPARMREKRRRVMESDDERTTGREKGGTKKSCPEPGVVLLAQTRPEAPPPISAWELSISEQHLPHENREESGKEVTTEEEDVDVTQVSSALQMIREDLQTQSRVENREETNQREGREKPEEGIDVENMGTVEEDSDESIDVVGDDEGMKDKADHVGLGTSLLSVKSTQWKVPNQLPSVEPPGHPSSHFRRDVEIEGSTGSWEEEEEVDVLGSFSPYLAPPVTTADCWGEGLSTSEDEEEDIDVIGGELDHTPFIGHLL